MTLIAIAACVPFVAVHANDSSKGAAMPAKVSGSPEPVEISNGALAAKLNALAKSLVDSGASQDDVACFLMRSAFSCFAEDWGILPRNAFQNTLINHKLFPEKCGPAITALWKTMKGCGGGWLFETPESLALNQQQVAMLSEVASADWSRVDVTIFGSILENALAPTERQQLGTHYTPATYVERLVIPTVIDPLRAEWNRVNKADPQAVRQFHERLCKVVVLDPACGSGNFLGTSFELLNALDGEVTATLRKLGQPDAPGSVGIQQFRGVEIAPHSADVCELVLRVVWLKSYYKTHKTPPPEIDNKRVVECRDAILASDSVQNVVDASGKITRYINPRPAEWPKCDFIVGNPPFVGNSKMRQTLGDAYVIAIRGVYEDVPGKCDYVMYWWYKAAELLEKGEIQRFGLITTSSIRSKFNSKVIAGFLEGNPPISLVYAIPDHPWGAGTAKVRIAMTVCARGDVPGTLATVSRETPNLGAYDVELAKQEGKKITSTLTLGADITKAKALRANGDICTRGVMLSSPGFIVSAEQAKELGLGTEPGLENHIRQYQNGKDINAKSRDVLVIDMTGCGEKEVKEKFPKIYAYLLEHVKPSRENNNNGKLAANWWLFGNQKIELKKSLDRLGRYIATSETAKNQCFVFLDKDVLPDNKLVVVCSDDAYVLGVLSSRIHCEWAEAAGGRLGKAPVYSKTTCFDPFPFPAASKDQEKRIREIAAKLDAYRDERQKEHPDLTLSDMYSVLEKVNNGEQLTQREQQISRDGGIPGLKKLHDDLDTAVFDAYGWPADLDSAGILDHVLSLNEQRAAEEKSGHIHWVRPR